MTCSECGADIPNETRVLVIMTGSFAADSTETLRHFRPAGPGPFVYCIACAVAAFPSVRHTMPLPMRKPS